jgi:hypothetical protein
MALAVAVQYNDPDGPLWMLYYGVPAVWAAIAAFRPDLLRGRVGRTLLSASCAAALLLTVLYWPPVAGWWRDEVWSMAIAEPGAAALAEQAREGMGIMIATAVLLLVLVATVFGRNRRLSEGQPATAGSRLGEPP